MPALATGSCGIPAAGMPHLSDFAPLGSIDEGPDRRVITERLEAMHDPRGGEQDVPRAGAVPLWAVDEGVLAPGRDRDLVARMRLLGVAASGRSRLDRDRPVLEGRREAAASPRRKALQPSVPGPVGTSFRAGALDVVPAHAAAPSPCAI